MAPPDAPTETAARGFDDRGVSEGASVAVLVVLTVVVTASIGVGVLIADTDEELDAELSFNHLPQREAMLITYEDGDPLRASNVVISGSNDVTWATLAGLNETATISQGDRVQLTEANAYGATVTEEANVSVVHVQNDTETVLGDWSGG